MTLEQRGGVFLLRTPLDLLRKMEFHFGQLTADPANDYAAFDFFVAAEHLPEWLGKFQCAPGAGDEKGQALRRVSSQIANGAKHFFADERHSAVRATGISTPARFGIAQFGITLFCATNPVHIVLLPEEVATALDLPAPTVSAAQLARMVLTYWREHDAVKRAAAKLESEAQP
jgi:hypothetical protein